MKTPWETCLEGMILLLDNIMALFRSLEEGLCSLCLRCLHSCNEYKNLLAYIHFSMDFLEFIYFCKISLMIL